MCLCTRTARKLPLKVNKGKGKLLLSKNVKIEYLRNKLMKYKSPVLWKMQPNLLQNCANWNTRKEKVLKPNSVWRIVVLCKNCKKTLFISK